MVTRRSLKHAINVALMTMSRKRHQNRPDNMAHKPAATVSGGLGGALGMMMLVVKLPVTTVIMLRSIADIGRKRRGRYGGGS